MKTRGRPAKEAPKNIQYRLRMNREEAAILDYIRERTGKSKAEIVVEGLRMQYNLAKHTE